MRLYWTIWCICNYYGFTTPINSKCCSIYYRLVWLLSSVVFEKIYISHLCNTWRWRLLELNFVGEEAKMSNELHNDGWNPWITLSETVNLYEIEWTVIEQSRPEHDPTWTRLCESLSTGSRLWRHFRSNEHHVLVNFEVASSSCLRYIERNHFVMAVDIDDSISERAFAFRLKTRLINKCNVNPSSRKPLSS